MYPVSTNRASSSFLSVILLLALGALVSGCGASAPPDPQSLTLSDDLPATHIRWCRSISGKSGGPHVYECSSCHGELFFTALQQCGVGEQIAYQATTRQLLVGLGQLEQLNQTPVELSGSKTLRTIFRGSLDADLLLLADFTARSEDCIIDFVVWRRASRAADKTYDVGAFIEDATTLATVVNSSRPPEGMQCTG